MLAKSLIEEINRLLKQGKLSQRKIAAQMRVSRGTVAAIASGRRGLYGREPSENDSTPFAPQSPPVRCPRCGYRVYLPCLICRSREFQERQTQLRAAMVESQRLAAPSGASQSQPEGETRRQGERDQILCVAPAPCLLVFSAPAAGIPVLTFIPAFTCPSA